MELTESEPNRGEPPQRIPGNGVLHGSTGTLTASPRPAIWQNVPDAEWNDWHWQIRHRITRADQLRQIIHLTPDEERAIALRPEPPLAITPYFAALMDPDDPRCPIRQQVVPTSAELIPGEAGMEDPLGEDAHMPVPGLTHRYPDRVLVIITDQCVAYCRHCTRRRLVGSGTVVANRARIDAMAGYIAARPEIRDVLISGGDGMFVADEMLEYVLKSFRSIPHLEIIRIGSRVPIFLPQRVTPKFTEMIRKYHPVWMNLHINHPKEITPEVSRALAMLADAGIPLGSQTVLLAGINDCPNTIKRLVQLVVKNRVRPYYLYQCDLSEGIGHFRTPVSVGIGIIEALRGHTSGFAIPTFCIDAPAGGGKIPLMPQYLISQSASHVVVRNYEGAITAYPEPREYARHDPATCPECRGAKPAEGVNKLLLGQGMVLEPEGMTRATRRKEEHHPSGKGNGNGNGNGAKPAPQAQANQQIAVVPPVASWDIQDAVVEFN